jgi:hypothetical protein
VILNKMNNHLSPKTIEHKRKTETFAGGNPGPGLRQAQKCVSTWTHYKAANTNCEVFGVTRDHEVFGVTRDREVFGVTRDQDVLL